MQSSTRRLQRSLALMMMMMVDVIYATVNCVSLVQKICIQDLLQCDFPVVNQLLSSPCLCRNQCLFCLHCGRLLWKWHGKHEPVLPHALMKRMKRWQPDHQRVIHQRVILPSVHGADKLNLLVVLHLRCISGFSLVLRAASVLQCSQQLLDQICCC